jgi:hypothetical protein
MREKGSISVRIERNKRETREKRERKIDFGED